MERMEASTRQPALRKDAARNRCRIMDAARALLHKGRPVQLNAVAQAADVGVGTVYRHFPTPEALVEALAVDQFAALVHQAEQAADARVFLKTAVTAYLQDDMFAAAVVDPNPTTPEIQILRYRLQDAFLDLLACADTDGALHSALTVADVMPLLCGIGFAIRHAADPDDPTLPDRYLSALLDGVLTRPVH
jgi:AcrR family transcriptional regulator